jgi:hypothetical protein
VDYAGKGRSQVSEQDTTTGLPDGFEIIHDECYDLATAYANLAHIGTKYDGIRRFANEHVVGANLKFARIDSIVGVLEHVFETRYPGLKSWLVDEREIAHEDPEAVVDELIAEHPAMASMRERLVEKARQTSLLLLARPLDNDAFLERGVIEISESIEAGASEAEMESLLSRLFVRPRLDDVRCIGRSTLAGGVSVTKSWLIASEVRGDELGKKKGTVMNESMVMDGSVLAFSVCHGHGGQTMLRTVAAHSVLHHDIYADGCEFGTAPGSSVVINGSTFVNVKGDRFTANAVEVRDREIAPGTVLHADRSFPADVVSLRGRLPRFAAHQDEDPQGF